MQLVEKHIINKNHSFYKEIDVLSFASKNLYNSLNFIVRQNYFETKKYIGFSKLYHSIKKENIWNDCKLPKKVCNQVVKLVDQNYRSFFEALKSFSMDPTNFIGKPKIPKYKDVLKGRCILAYETGALSSLVYKKTGKLKLSDTNIILNTQIKNFKDIKQVRIVPRNKCYVIEIVYDKLENEIKHNNNLASIDLGLNNLATVAFNDCKTPLILNGKPLKSINQFYNKKLSKLKSNLTNQNKHESNATIKLTNKRNNKIVDYLHKSSRILVNQLVSKNVSKLIIGYNKNWKQDIKIGKKNNQNFVNIPHHKFISMLEYKCRLEGISVQKTEESYTSKCSFLDNEEMKHQDDYLGKRIKRGLFKSKENILINADLNGAYNIMRKVVPNFIEGIEAIAVWPKKLKTIS